MRLFLTRLFLFTGILCVILFSALVYQRYRPNPLAFKGIVATHGSPVTMREMPVRIAIPELAIDLPIHPSVIHGTAWETSDRAVSYLTSSPLPGKMGNAVLYGHNWSNLLGPLHQAHIGDKVIIYYENGDVNSFIISYITIVSPDQIKILENSKDTRLTLYTCTGFLDSKRLVITALSSDLN